MKTINTLTFVKETSAARTVDIVQNDAGKYAVRQDGKLPPMQFGRPSTYFALGKAQSEVEAITQSLLADGYCLMPSAEDDKPLKVAKRAPHAFKRRAAR